MKFVETLTPAVEERLTAQTKKKLHKKVANSDKSYHKGYPDETGYVPSILIDPKHKSDYNKDINICNNDDTDKMTVYTFCLAFPHISLSKNAKSGYSINDVTSNAFVDAYDIIQNPDEETRQVLQERERLRLKSIRNGHEYKQLEDKILTADTEEKIIINAYRAAYTRVKGEPTVQEIKKVLSFKRNNFEPYLHTSIKNISDDYILNIINNKTCSPLIPSNENEKKVLLYWIDNPDASISEVVENTNVSRGKFETFRLNLPPVECYNRSYIESQSFDYAHMIEKLNDYIISSKHNVYGCSECEKWSYSVMSLSAHKMNSKDHTVNEVTQNELNDLITKEDKTEPVSIEPEISVDDMIQNYANNKSKTDLDSLAKSLYKSDEPLYALSDALGESVLDVLKRVTDNLSQLEQEQIKQHC